MASFAALNHRARSGQGQYIDISQAETAASMIGPALLDLLVNGREPQPQGNFSASAAPHGAYRCKGDDRWCVIAAETDAQWAALARILGVTGDARFASNALRNRHRGELKPLLEAKKRGSGRNVAPPA